MSGRVVHKQDVTTDVRHSIPGEPLHFGNQNGRLCVWFEPSSEVHEVQIFGTGHAEIPDHGVYIGTAMINSGEFVFHLYDVTGRTGA